MVKKVDGCEYRYKKCLIKRVCNVTGYGKVYAIYEIGNYIASAPTLEEAKQIIDELED